MLVKGATGVIRGECLFSSLFFKIWWRSDYEDLSHEQLEVHGCLLSTVATDVLVLKHQAIDIHSAEYIHIVLDQFHTEILYK